MLWIASLSGAYSDTIFYVTDRIFPFHNQISECHNHFYKYLIANQDLILHQRFLDIPNQPGTGK